MTTFQKTPTINYIYPSGKEKLAETKKPSVRKKLTAKPSLNDDELFTVQSANKWMQDANKRPVPKMLFGKFWFENEICILFADSNLGKSIIAVQIGDAISGTQTTDPFIVEAVPQPILYCDFELTDKQFEARYSVDFKNHYSFNENFFRAEMNPEIDVPKGYKDFDEYLIDSLERSIVQTGAKVVIVDNITYLRSENEKAKDALPLMKHLKVLKNRYDLSLLVLAHTPKRDLGKEITRNDLQGSKMLMNFCDSSFAVGESTRGKQIRYLKQIKQRNTDQVYGGNNVVICEITKPHNFLQYEFRSFGHEADHLVKKKRDHKFEKKEEALALYEQGLTLRQIADQLGVSFQRIDRLIKKAKEERE
jgi:hypothetical protein